MKKINLTQAAYRCGGSIRLNGGRSAEVLYDWYEAQGYDDDGLEYMVIWDLLPDYDPETVEEEVACDWDNPTEVYCLDESRALDENDYEIVG